MKIEDIIKLVDAGFKAEHIAQMYAAEKIEVQNNAPKQEAPLPGAASTVQSNTEPIPTESGKAPDPEPSPTPDPKPEESTNKELDDLKQQLEQSQAAVQNLQNMIASINVGGTQTETVEDHLHKMFEGLY